MLAAEGFLPGYGLEVGLRGRLGRHPVLATGAMDFSLPRPPATALREYVPGNLIYANGHRFVARRFHPETDKERAEMPYYEVSAEHQAVKAASPGAGTTLGGGVLQTMAVCDADLIHTSHISDEEELRFQLGVAIYGLELEQHNGGAAYRWGAQSVQLRPRGTDAACECRRLRSDPRPGGAWLSGLHGVRPERLAALIRTTTESVHRQPPGALRASAPVDRFPCQRGS